MRLYKKNVKYFGGHVRFLLASPSNCKVYFTKIRNFAFFLITIMYNSKKCIIFAPELKNDHKDTTNF